MDIKRIDTYHNSRFSQRALNQHGCFLVGNDPYEVEILSDREAVIRGKDPESYIKVIDAFRFYTPHISRFYNQDRHDVCRGQALQNTKTGCLVTGQPVFLRITPILYRIAMAVIVITMK